MIAVQPILQDLRSHKKGLFLKHYTWNSTRYMFACCGLQRAVQRDLHGAYALLKEAKPPAICYPLHYSIWLTSVLCNLHLEPISFVSRMEKSLNEEVFSVHQYLSKCYMGVSAIEKYISQTASRILASVRFPHLGYWNSQTASNVNVTFCKFRRSLAQSRRAMQRAWLKGFREFSGCAKPRTGDS